MNHRGNNPGRLHVEAQIVLSRVLSAVIGFILALPLLAYLDYHGMNPRVVFALLALSVPASTIFGDRYLYWAKRLYRTKYRTYTIEESETAVRERLKLTLFAFDLKPTPELRKQVLRLEERGWIKPKSDISGMVRDVLTVLFVTIGVYAGGIAILAYSPILRWYVALLTAIFCFCLFAQFPSRRRQALETAFRVGGKEDLQNVIAKWIHPNLYMRRYRKTGT